MNVFVRWATAGLFAGLITPAFTGFFGTLTIQIADAPTLAGLVVNMDVFNAAALLGFSSLLLFATFPRWSPWAFAALLPVTMIGTGWQIQDQYQGFRGQLNPADVVGQEISSTFSANELANTWVVAASRFEATNVAIWADNAELDFQILFPGSQIATEDLPEGTQRVVLLGDFELVGNFYQLGSGEGFSVYRVD